MSIFFVSLFFSLNYIAVLYYLPFFIPFFPYSDGGGELCVLTILNAMGFVVMVLPHYAFIHCTKKYIKLNAETTLSFFQQKDILNSIEDISVKQCGNGIWILSVKDKEYTINLKVYIFQKSFIMGIFVRLLYYKYIKTVYKRTLPNIKKSKLNHSVFQ